MSGPATVSSGDPSSHHDRRNAFLCGLLVACAIWAAWPVAEVGRDDDWSYARTSLDLARTGRLIYNGWSTAMLGAQAYWGAAVIKLFGFGFTTLRISVLPFACCSASILYLLARRLGASGAIAMMAALTIGLSQITIICGSTFCTDLTALFCFTLGLHQFIRALDAERRLARQIAAPLLLAAAVGYAGGSIRQVYWLTPLIGLGYVAWVRRRERRQMLLASALLAAVVFAILATETWAHAQPFFLPEYLRPTAVVFFGDFPRTLLPAITLGMTLTLFALPMIIGVWAALKRPGSVPAMAVGILLAVAAIGWRGRGALAPWLGNIVTEYGTKYPGLDAIGDQPQIIPDAVRLLLTFLCATAAAALFWAAFKSTPRLVRSARDGSLPHLLRLTALFALPYTAMILFRGPAFGLVDRYSLPLTSILCLWLAWLAAERGLVRINIAGPSILILVALFAIASCHDDYAAARARLRAVSTLTSHGIARTSITAGADYDAWTQVEQVGYVNDARILNPPGAFVPHPRSVPEGQTDYWYWEWTPEVRPKYFVVDTPQPDLQTLSGMTIPWHSWLSPFDRAVYVQKRPAG